MNLYLAIVFPFGVFIYLFSLILQGVLGARKGYLGGLLVASLYLIGGLAYCLGAHTMEDFYLTLLLTILQAIVFAASLIYTNQNVQR